MFLQPHSLCKDYTHYTLLFSLQTTLPLLSRVQMSCVSYSSLTFISVKRRTQPAPASFPFIFKSPPLHPPVACWVSSHLSPLAVLPRSAFGNVRLVAWNQSSQEHSHHRNWQIQSQSAFIPGKPIVKHVSVHHYMSLELSCNVQPDGYSYLNLSWTSQTLLAKTKTWVSDVFLLPFSILSLLRKEPHIFQSAMYEILVLSLFYLYTNWGNAVLMVVPLKLFVKPPFFFISFAKLRYVIPEYIQETPSFFF